MFITNVAMYWILIVIVLFLVFLYFTYMKPYRYWLDKSVPQLSPHPLFGNSTFCILRTMSFFDMVLNIYKKYPEKRYFGIYQFLEPVLVIRDPEIIKHILVKDFEHFTDHISSVAEEKDPLWSKLLFSLKGSKWRNMRQILSPVFSSSKMKTIFPVIFDKIDNFTNYYINNKKGIIKMDIRDYFQRLGNDVIAITSFGIECDSLKNPNNELRLIGLEMFGLESYWKNLKFFLVIIIPKFARFLKVSIFSNKATNFMVNLVKRTIKARNEMNIVRPDIIQLLMDLKKGNLPNLEETLDKENENYFSTNIVLPKKADLTDMDCAAHAMMFFFGGFDTLSLFLSLMAYELTVNTDVQEKLQNEIDSLYQMCDGKLTYDNLMKLKYLDMVTSEILRKWPIAFEINRECVKPYTIPPATSEEKPIHLNIGDKIWIPVAGIHRDPQFYPEPDSFNPDRFGEDTKSDINPYTYFPFGGGPRTCIGYRFALLISKVTFVQLLLKFNLVAIKETQIPLHLSKTSYKLDAERGFWIGLQSRKNI